MWLRCRRGDVYTAAAAPDGGGAAPALKRDVYSRETSAQLKTEKAESTRQAQFRRLSGPAGLLLLGRLQFSFSVTGEAGEQFTPILICIGVIGSILIRIGQNSLLRCEY